MLIGSEPLKAIEVGLNALSSLGFQIPFDEASAAHLAEELSPQISRDRAVIAVGDPLILILTADLAIITHLRRQSCHSCARDIFFLGIVISSASL